MVDNYVNICYNRYIVGKYQKKTIHLEKENKMNNREDFIKRIKANIPSGNYPFDAEEMLLNVELKTKEENKENENNKMTRRLGDYPFDAEEMLLNAELKGR